MDRQEMIGRTKRLALRCMKLATRLPRSRAGNIAAGQLIRCGTSVGANYRAACRARSRKDFIYRVGVVEEEADECAYWMEIVMESGMQPSKLIQPLHGEAVEIVQMMVTSARTAQANGRARTIRNPGSSIRNPQSAIRNIS